VGYERSGGSWEKEIILENLSWTCFNVVTVAIFKKGTIFGLGTRRMSTDIIFQTTVR
jgi:hypothetical protein